MTVRTSLALIGGGVVLVSAWVLVQAQGAPVAATITLATSGGTCGKTLVGNDPAVSDRIRAKRGAAVHWTVVNNCTGNQTVALGDFARKSDNVAESPFGAGGNRDCVATQGQRCTITLTVRPNAPTITYTYSTSINGVKRDPDIMIEP